MLYLGLMSGTSMDAVDVALVEFYNRACILHYEQYLIDTALKQRLRLINKTTRLDEVAEMDYTMGHIFASAVSRFLQETGAHKADIAAIGSHGQTVYHCPNKDWQTSMQLGDPNIICAQTGITTVADFRRMDMALGGQGAPLASVFHSYQFQDKNTNRTILNIGGIANITTLPADEKRNIIGFDTGPGNGLLDDWNYKHNKTSMDKDGAWAKSGTNIPALLCKLTKDSYFSTAPPKSTDRGYFNLNWLDKHLSENVSASDVQATLLELSMVTIADAIRHVFQENEEVYICGGGAKNPIMVNRLNELLPSQKIATTQKLGIDPDAVEAATIAWLAFCRINNMAIDLGRITGSRKPMLAGAIYRPVNS